MTTMAAQPPQPTIRSARLTLIAGSVFFDHRSRSPTVGESALWRLPFYRATYNQLQAGAASGTFAQAWRPRQRSQFWSLYLGGQDLGGVDADTAYDKIVPLRLLDAVPALLVDRGARVVLDAYGYPNGIVLALTIQIGDASGLSMADWRDRARRLRLEPVFRMPSSGQPAGPPITAQRLSEDVLARLRARYYVSAGESWTSSELLSVHGVVQGSGVDPALAPDDDLIRSLWAVTAWPTDWARVGLPKTDDPRVALPAAALNQYAGDIHLAAKRGRTFWRPGLFGYRRSPGERPTHVLSCLLHNMVAGAVQVEAMRLFARGYAHSVTARAQLDPSEVARYAKASNDLIQGTRSYRSASLQEQLRDSGTRAEVNALLSAHGYPVIS